MFINKTRFKQAIKEAYNNNSLQVGVPEEWGGVFIEGPGWEVWTDRLPNWAKAALIEHIGELPEAGEKCRYGKELKEMEKTTAWPGDDYLQLLRGEAKEPCMITPIMQGEGKTTIRFAQSNITKKILWTPEKYYALLDFDQMEEDEGRTEGPGMDARSGMIYWKNDHCILGVYVQNTAQVSERLRPLMQRLEEINFEEI